MIKLVDNRPVIKFLSILIGALIALNLVGAQSFLIANTDPVFLIVFFAVGSVGFSIFIKFFKLESIKFSNFCILFFIITTFLLATFLLPFWSDFFKAVIWFGFVIFLKELTHWQLNELAIRYLNPAHIQTHITNINLFMEAGSVLILLFTILLSQSPTPTEIIIYSEFILLALILMMLVFYVYLPNPVLIKKSKNNKHHNGRKISKKFKGMFYIFMVITLLFGICDFFTHYVSNLVFKNELQSYEKISELIIGINIYASIAVLLVIPIVGWFIKHKRTSPVVLYFIYALIMLSLAVLCFFVPNIYSFIALYSAYTAFYKAVPSIARRVVFSGFAETERVTLQAFNTIMYLVVPNVFTATIMSFEWPVTYETKIAIIVAAMVFNFIIVLFLLGRFKISLGEVLFKNLRSEDNGRAVAAAQLLSYVYPKGYIVKITEILAKDIKKSLRRIIVLGLGYKAKTKGVDLAIKEFETDSEEIQMAVIDTLRGAKTYEATSFLINLLTHRGNVHSINVRTYAASVIAKIYGKKAIPILLTNLSDRDTRIVANAIEELGDFKDIRIARKIKPFVFSETPRIKANAITAISKFKQYQKLSVRELFKMLNSDNPNMVASALYAIGKKKDKRFLKRIQRLYKSNVTKSEMVTRCLAFSLSELNQVEGFDLFKEYLSTVYHKGEVPQYLHFFSQLRQITRFSILQYLFADWKIQPNQVLKKNCIKHLKMSRYDFSNEINFVREIAK